jgi:hypothetical protein
MRMSQRASRWEIAGAWLHVWTPPRDVVVPDPPWRRIVLIAALALAAAGVALAFIGPAIDRAKDRAAREDARRLAANRRVENARLIRDQRMIEGRARIPKAVAGTPAAEAPLTHAIALAVVAEARRRHAAGDLESPIAEDAARCRRRPSTTTTRLRLECLAVTSSVESGDERGRVGSIGYPFLAAGSLETGRFNFCKTNPPPGENAATFGKGGPPELPKGCGF